jgi:ATP-dependent exoDNAse (exonuclease V) beta subunit
LDGASEHTEFGQVLHDALETYLSTRTMPDVEELKKQLQEKFSALENSASLKEKDWHNRIEPILKSVPSFLDSNFPGWEYIAAEHELYEDIEFQTRKFKGFIDGVIRVPTGKNGEYIYHIIDWKTTSWGWTLQKKIDKKKILQLALYKFFYTKKFNLDMSKVKCHFVLLKRTAKENPCELVTVSVGPKAIEEATGTVQRMLSSVKKGFFLKTKESCSQCIYNKTEHCT